MKRILMGLFLCTALSSQTIDRTKPPVSPDPRPYKLPSVFETKLPNGLTVLLVEDVRVPLVTMRLAFAGGTKRDPADLPGLAEAMAGLLMEGTATRTSQQIAEQLDSLGASLNASAATDQFVIGGSVVSENTAQLLEMMSDATRNASFPEKELTLRKQNRKQTLAAQRSQSAFLAAEEFRKAVFGDNAYAHLGPTPESIDKMDRNAIVQFRDAHLVPNNAYLILAGKLPPRAQLMKAVTDNFGSWQRKDLPDYKPTAPPAPKKQFILVDRPGSVQADVQMGRLADTRHDPDYFPTMLGTMIMGGGPNSRLFLDIREKRGYAYDAHTELGSYDEAGTFAVVTQVRNEVVAEALGGVMENLARIGKEPVEKTELSDAKSFVNGTFLLRMEPQAGLADQLVLMKIQNLPKDYLETYTTHINSVEPQQIEDAAKRYMASGEDALIVVGDAAKIGPALEKVGKFEVVKQK